MISSRHKSILDLASTEGSVGVEDLAGRFGVTPQTIRRDLNELCDRGLLTRMHGGARPPNSVANVSYDERQFEYSEEKKRIGLAAASMIPRNCSIILNIGTTTEAVALAIYDHRDLVVITNNLNVVNILRRSPAKELIIAGGVVRQSDGGVVGEATTDFIRNFRVDIAVIGASAVGEDGAILDFDYREVSVARTIIETAHQTMLVFDHGKFEKRAPVRICDVADIDIIITDAPPPPRFMRVCKEANTRIVVADKELEETLARVSNG
ncbi:MAG TPA: DeoR/GlpR family DNA-binding transcription regulator [Hyphomicrobiales bacterium]|nr:DeoR/GlpR family DNA-binding transcription regulator [Hyphomicrobiales bacterium]